MKEKHTAIVRPFGQTSISSFLVKPRSLEEGQQPKSVNTSISKASDANLAKFSNRTIKVKQNAFSSIGSTRNNPNDEKEVDNGCSVLSEAVFKQFNNSAEIEDILGIENNEYQNDPELHVSESEVEPRFDLGKRKNPFGGDTKPQPQLQPLPKRKKVKLASNNKREKPFYNHYASGRGRWDGDMEGVDYEEVGFDAEVWEGMGSTMLGSLDWN